MLRAVAGASATGIGAIPESEKGQPNGVATLDAGGKVPLSEMPFGGLTYQGAWDASTNIPMLADGVGTTGDFYRVSQAGSQDLGSGSQSFAVGDHVIYEGAIWQKIGGAAGSSTVDLAANYPWTGPHSHTQPVTFIGPVKNYDIHAANISGDDRLIFRSLSAIQANYWFDSFANNTGISLAEGGVEKVFFGTELAANLVLDTKTYGFKLKTSSGANFAFLDTSILTTDRTFQFPDAGGTIALTSGFASGTYAPTVTPGSNAASATANGPFIYSRVGSTVQIAGELAVTAQAAGPTLIDFSLPVAPPAFANTHQLAGSGAATTGGATTPFYARSNVGTTNGTINWIAPNMSAHTMHFVATYTTT